MSEPINDGGPAFPGLHPSKDCRYQDVGMTLRQYAAIKLCVPDSGVPWLDEMIVQSNRERLAAAALQGLLGNSEFHVAADVESEIPNAIAKYAYEAADAMLKAREAK